MRTKEMLMSCKETLEARAKDLIETQKALGMDDSFGGDRCKAIILESLIDTLIHFEVIPEMVVNDANGKESKTKALLLFVLTNECRNNEGKKGREAGFPTWMTQTSTIQKKAVEWGVYPEREKKAKEGKEGKESPTVNPLDVLNNL